MTKKRKFWAALRAHRNRGGFTLVELVVVMGLASILLMGAVFIFFSAQKAFVTTQVRNRQMLLMDGMMEAISTELRYATEVTINETSGGSIYTIGEDLYIARIAGSEPAILGNGNQIAMTFVAVDDFTLSLDIALTDAVSETTTQESTTIRLINCEQIGNALAVPSSGSTVTYAS